jgi:hypothetical protein
VTSAPLARGSISLRLYPHDLEPPRLSPRSSPNACWPNKQGFDGVMTQEHHGGFPTTCRARAHRDVGARADQHVVGRAVSDLVAVATVDAARRRPRVDIASLSGTHRCAGSARARSPRFRDGRRAFRRDAVPVRGRATRGRGGARRARDGTAGQRPGVAALATPRSRSSSPHRGPWRCGAPHGSGSGPSTTRYRHKSARATCQISRRRRRHRAAHPDSPRVARSAARSTR